MGVLELAIYNITSIETVNYHDAYIIMCVYVPQLITLTCECTYVNKCVVVTAPSSVSV